MTKIGFIARLALVIAVGILYGLAKAGAATDIYNDDGGSVLMYVDKFSNASKPIRIHGRCASACTLALHYPGTCVGPGARLVFHAPYGSTPTVNALIKSMMMKAYPPAIRAWLNARGGLTSKPLTLQGAQLRARVRSC